MNSLKAFYDVASPFIGDSFADCHGFSSQLAMKFLLTCKNHHKSSWDGFVIQMESVFRELLHNFLYVDKSVPLSQKSAAKFLEWGDAKCSAVSGSFAEDKTFSFMWELFTHFGIALLSFRIGEEGSTFQIHVMLAKLYNIFQ